MPEGICADGFPAVRETCRKIGIEFDQWQADLNRCLLAKDDYGVYAADTAVLSIGRQVGKTYDVGAVAFALCIAIPGLTVVWTAHRFKVSRETFMEMRAWAKRRELVAHIEYDDITTGAGTECIPFRNGSRIVFAARERGSIRGFTKVGLLVLDEAQILTETALADLVPTTNQSPNPLIILMGTPPKPTDPSEVFVRLRAEALEGVSRDVLYVEFSAERGCDPDDEAAWRVANPSYPRRTPAKAILRMRKLLNPDNFMREALGVWDESPGYLIDPVAFAGRFTERPKPTGQPVFFLEVAYGMRSAAIGVASQDHGPVHLEIADHAAGTDWLVERAAELKERHPDARWCCAGSGAVGVFLPELAERGIEPEEFNGLDMGRACGHLQKVVADKSVTISEERALVAALAAAEKADVGDGLWKWSQRRSVGDISPLNAITGAAWGHAKFIEEPVADIF